MAKFGARRCCTSRYFFRTLALIVADWAKVIGERIVTVGSIVQLVVKVKMTHPVKHAPNGIEAEEDDLKILQSKQPVQAAEQDLEELIGRKKKGADGEEENYWVSAPRYPSVSHIYSILTSPYKESAGSYTRLELVCRRSQT